jgi:Rho-binding antiterminator
MLETISSKSTYSPINCSFHDQLLELATFKPIVKVIYTNQENERITISVSIKDIYTAKSKEEFLVLSSGQEIRLDRIIQAGQYLPPDFKCV